jgi:hypothetical protein
VGLTTPHRKRNKLVTRILKKPRTWTDSLDKRPKQKKMDMRFGMWNVRSMYRAGSLGSRGRSLRIGESPTVSAVIQYRPELVFDSGNRWQEFMVA